MTWRTVIERCPRSQATLMFCADTPVGKMTRLADGRVVETLPVILKPLEFAPHDMGVLTPAAVDMPTGETEAWLQSVVDAAWDFGIRPKKLEDADAALRATRDHLADMQKYADKFVDIAAAPPFLAYRSELDG